MKKDKEVNKTRSNNNLWAGTNPPDVSFLIQVVKLPVVLIVLVEAVLIVFTTRYWQDVFWWLDYNIYVIIGLKVLAAGWLSWLLLSAVEKRINLTAASYTTGFLGGFLAGLLIAIFKIFWYYEFWTFFNLIAEPLTTALIGTLLVRVFMALLRSFFLKNN